MEDTINWRGQKYKLEWFDNFDKSLLKNLQQVYGFLFTEKGELCIVRPNKKSFRDLKK